MTGSAIDGVRVMLVGDCPLVRSGFRQVLESAGIVVVASVRDAVEAAGLLRGLPADVVVIGAVTRQAAAADIGEIASCHPAVPVLVLGRSGEALAVRAALDCGARGYLALNDAVDADLIHAVRSVAAGEVYLSPELVAAPVATARIADGAYQRLTDRERQVLTLVAGGRSNREIAQMLGLSANTVAVHRANVMKTLAVRKTAALVLFAVRHGLVTAD
jgi:DNA-binding NarL/FixJ family response regulator